MYDLCRTFVEQNNKEGHMHLLMHRLSHSLHFEKMKLHVKMNPVVVLFYAVGQLFKN
jgi:hypothetical protein